MPLAEYTFLDVFWSFLVFFVWVAWFILLFRIVADVFRRHDIGGGKKTVWLLFILFVPFIGTFAYLIANSNEMARRDFDQAAASRKEFEDYVRTVAQSQPTAAEVEQSRPLPT